MWKSNRRGIDVVTSYLATFREGAANAARQHFSSAFSRGGKNSTWQERRGIF